MRRSPRPRSTPTSAGRRRAPDFGRGVERGARNQAMRGPETHPSSHSSSQFCSLTFSLSSRFPLTRTQGGAGTDTAIREVAAVLLTGLERRPGAAAHPLRRLPALHPAARRPDRGHRADGAPAPARSTAARARGPRARAEHRPVGPVQRRPGARRQAPLAGRGPAAHRLRSNPLAGVQPTG